MNSSPRKSTLGEEEERGKKKKKGGGRLEAFAPPSYTVVASKIHPTFHTLVIKLYHFYFPLHSMLFNWAFGVCFHDSVVDYYCCAGLGWGLTHLRRERDPPSPLFIWHQPLSSPLPRRTEIDLKEEERKKRDAWNFLFFSFEGLYVVARPAQRLGLYRVLLPEARISTSFAVPYSLENRGKKGRFFFFVSTLKKWKLPCIGGQPVEEKDIRIKFLKKGHYEEQNNKTIKDWIFFAQSNRRDISNFFSWRLSILVSF